MSPDEEKTDVSSMTKAELEEEADRRGVEVTSSMTKAEMLEALGEGPSHFVTPRITQTSVPGREKLSDEERERISQQAGGGADQSSLGGTGGTTVEGIGEPGAGPTAP